MIKEYIKRKLAIARMKAHRPPKLTYCFPSSFPAVRKNLTQRKTVRNFMASFLALLIASVSLSLILGVRFTLTPSLPIGLYRTVNESPERGSLVAVCLPDHLAMQAKDRGYGRPGGCNGGVAPLLKMIAAMPNDGVYLTDSGLIVNGNPIPNTMRRSVDSEGRPISMIKNGAYSVKDNEVWLIANHSVRSWDSRYFGPIPMDRVQSVMRPLLTWGN